MTWQEQPCKDLEVEGADEGWEKPKPALYSISFADRLRGWIVGMDGVILHTGDGGMTWNKIDSGTDKPLYTPGGQRAHGAGLSAIRECISPAETAA